MHTHSKNKYTELQLDQILEAIGKMRKDDNLYLVEVEHNSEKLNDFFQKIKNSETEGHAITGVAKYLYGIKIIFNENLPKDIMKLTNNLGVVRFRRV